MNKLTANAKIGILQPIEKVYHAIIDPKHLCNYFLKESSGFLETGVSIEWQFPEFPDKFPIDVKQVIPNEYISFDWSNGGENQLVIIKLQALNNQTTTVEVIEQEMMPTEEGIELMKQQTEGWSYFLACLKAYVEYGINLRKGAFDYRF